ncbi:MAG TPA: twin-arginine translocase subunit TatB [Sphingomicrobium sp.]|nr:twin-arginine translocase subunit TatB [Sphingomicrobium sp.]
MFGFDSAEIAIIAVLALIFIGPKELPRVMRTVGYWVGRVRGMARHFTSGIEDMIREAELEEMEKKWREENERIMRLHPANADYPEPGQADQMPPLEKGPDPISAQAPEPMLPFDEKQPGDELPADKRPLP